MRESRNSQEAGPVDENLFAFLPAKAGGGATTIALNVAGCLTHCSGADPGKVLLIDGDLHSGGLSVLLDCKHPFSVCHALDNATPLDYSQWTKYVTQSHGLDVLLSPQGRIEPQPSWRDYYHLLDFVTPRYDNIVVDLPEVLNDATVEIVRRAKQVFVVSSGERFARPFARKIAGVSDVLAPRWRFSKVLARSASQHRA